MSLEIEQGELGFRRPFTEEVEQMLKIHNVNKTPVAFKVKTTAPKQYCVRPNSGRIEPGEMMEISVLLQPMKQDPPLDAKCKDKFLVQSIAITAEKEFTNVAALWQQIDPADKSAVAEKKIRVAFLPAEGSPPPAYTPQKTVNGVMDSTPGGDAADFGSPANDSPRTKSEEESVEMPAEDFKAPAPADKDAAVAELKAQLLEAQTLLASYKASGLRQRKPVADGESEKPAPTALAQAPVSQGVPIQIAALLCFLSFLLAYFFF